MNYITINGKKSSFVQGLLISSLPPITKPLKRTMIEEIDGRDGDIVTDLGYSAYDKVVQIGLYGDYDVNEVIAFFDSEGVITFSNEPDKYYRFKTISQIDFDRLLRFKKAMVTFHVQPFKYSLVEKAINEIITPLLTFDDYSETQNNLTVTATNGRIKFEGEPTDVCEFYIPINEMELQKGRYTLLASAVGYESEKCYFRLIHNEPSTSNTFGGTFKPLLDNSTVSVASDINYSKTYNYLYFYVTQSQKINFDARFKVVKGAERSITLMNSGNTKAQPTLTIKGSGPIILTVNNSLALTIALGYEETITINSEQLEAYGDGRLKNRQVKGNYDALALTVGLNVIGWSGEIKEISVENYSRWV